MSAVSLGSPGFVSPFDASAQNKAKAQDATGTQGGAASSDPFATSNLGSTFLNLLIQELKNQDPTQPMDPTESVGQLISLNQLDQLISINQTLSPSTSTAASSGATSSGSSQPDIKIASAAGDAISPEKAAQTPAAQAQAAQQAALAALQAANANPSAPLNLNALSHILGAR